MKATRFDPDAPLIFVRGYLWARHGAQVPLRLVLDAGAAETVISPGVLDDDGYSAAQGEAITMTRSAVGVESGYFIRIARFRALGHELRDLRVDAHDLPYEIDGLLGLRFLRLFNYEIRSGEGRILADRRGSGIQPAFSRLARPGNTASRPRGAVRQRRIRQLAAAYVAPGFDRARCAGLAGARHRRKSADAAMADLRFLGAWGQPTRAARTSRKHPTPAPDSHASNPPRAQGVRGGRKPARDLRRGWPMRPTPVIAFLAALLGQSLFATSANADTIDRYADAIVSATSKTGTAGRRASEKLVAELTRDGVTAQLEREMPSAEIMRIVAKGAIHAPDRQYHAQGASGPRYLVQKFGDETRGYTIRVAKEEPGRTFARGYEVGSDGQVTHTSSSVSIRVGDDHHQLGWGARDSHLSLSKEQEGAKSTFVMRQFDQGKRTLTFVSQRNDRDNHRRFAKYRAPAKPTR